MAYDFPNAPLPGQVFQNWTWDSEKWVQTGNPAASGAVRFDLPQGLNANQMAQGRANIGDTKKNYIINGAMMISQENGATAGNAAAVGYYPVDQFYVVASSTTGVASAQWIASLAAGNSPNRIRITATTADTSVGTGDLVWFAQKMEGQRVADLKFGFSSAKTVTLQFGVKAPAGTYSVVFLNNAVNRSYVAEYVISSGQANTDTVQALVVPGDVTGLWQGDNTPGIEIRWGLMAGTTYQQAAGAWGTTNAVGSPNQFNFMGTVNNVFELFDVSLTEGSVAPPFQAPDYASELALCMRYFERCSGASVFGYQTAGQFIQSNVVFHVQKRAVPTFTGINWAATNNGGGQAVANQTADGFTWQANAVATGTFWFQGLSVIANARL